MNHTATGFRHLSMLSQFKKINPILLCVFFVHSHALAQEAQEFLPGAYKGPDEAECVLNVGELSDSSNQITMSCRDGYGLFLTATWFSGPIEGNPLKSDLAIAEIESISNADMMAWGKVGSSDKIWWGCLNAGDIISATSVGESLQVNSYGSHNQYVCGVTLLRNEVTQ